MPNKLVPPQTTTTTRTAATPIDGELLYDTDEKKFYQGDGVTVGGKAVGSTTFSDSTFRIQDNIDTTKQIAFETSGITTGTIRTITVPDKSGTIALVDTITATKTANYTASDDEIIPCDTSGGTFNVTTPTSGRFKVIDIIGNSSTTGFGVNGKELIILPASGTVMGASSLTLNVGAISPEFILIGTDWRIVNHG